MFRGFGREQDADYSPRPAYSDSAGYTAMATVTMLRHDPPAATAETVAGVAQDILKLLFTAGLDVRKLVLAAGSEAVAQQLRDAIDQLDAVINGIFAAVLDSERSQP